MVFEFRPILVVVPSQEPAVPFHLDLMNQPPVEAPLRVGGRIFILLGQDQFLKEGVARVKDQSLAGLEDHVVAFGAEKRIMSEEQGTGFERWETKHNVGCVSLVTGCVCVQCVCPGSIYTMHCTHPGDLGSW